MRECEGHPAGPFDPMGETVYCDGTCQPAEACAFDDGETPSRWWCSCERCEALVAEWRAEGKRPPAPPRDWTID